MSSVKHWEQDKEATVYIGNLDERITDRLVWELMLQVGRIVNVHLPKDRVTQTHQGYGFVEFISEEDAEYAARIMNQIRLFGKPVRVNKASADKQKSAEVGAELFVGNLDPMVSEQVLYDTFARFGTLISFPKVARDDSGLSKGYGFVSFSDFESSDEAITNLHGQYLMNKEVSVQYAYKKDGKGERHGDHAERILASQARQHNVAPAALSLTTDLLQVTTPSGTLNPIENQSSRHPGHAHSLPFQAGRTSAPTSFPVAPQRLPTPSQSLPAPPSGLPPRPPPSRVGYGGPSGVPPIAFAPLPTGFSQPLLPNTPSVNQSLQNYNRNHRSSAGQS